MALVGDNVGDNNITTSLVDVSSPFLLLRLLCMCFMHVGLENRNGRVEKKTKPRESVRLSFTANSWEAFEKALK